MGGAFPKRHYSLGNNALHFFIHNYTVNGISNSIFSKITERGEAGRKKITQITRYGTVLLASMQSYGVVAVFLPSLTSNGQQVVINPG